MCIIIKVIKKMLQSLQWAGKFAWCCSVYNNSCVQSDYTMKIKRTFLALFDNR